MVWPFWVIKGMVAPDAAHKVTAGAAACWGKGEVLSSSAADTGSLGRKVTANSSSTESQNNCVGLVFIVTPPERVDLYAPISSPSVSTGRSRDVRSGDQAAIRKRSKQG
jgi:hypothetical protein